MKNAIIDNANLGLGKLKNWHFYVLFFIWIAALLGRGMLGYLGVDPVARMTDATGMLGLQLLILGLWLTPMQRRLFIRVARFKRPIGLCAFFAALSHFLIWMVFDLGLNMSMVVDEIIKRPFLALGMGSLALLIPLAATSFNAAIRTLGGKAWKRLHKLVFPAIVLALIHFFMGSKVWEGEHIIWGALFATCLLERLSWSMRGRKLSSKKAAI